MRKRHRELHPGAPRGDIGVVELREQLAVPLREIGDGPAVEIAAHVERRRELLGRHRAQAEAMVPAGILQTKVDVLQARARARRAFHPAT